MGATDDLQEVILILETGEILPEANVVPILLRLNEVLYQESSVLMLSSPIVICGDIHGQLDDLLELFKISGDLTTQKYLFMGDYVDRGYHSLNTFLYLVCLKLQYPEQFYLLRGNHESRQVSQMYGFYNECISNYGHPGIWMMCNDSFDLLPLAAVIDRSIFSVHGGLSPQIPLIELISVHERQNELPSSGPLCDLCWSDPEEDVKKWRQNQRGAGYLFGINEVGKFNQVNKLRLITRSHQLAMEGYRWYFPDPTTQNPRGRLVIIWSAPNYSYRSGNDATIMKYGFTGMEEFALLVFRPNETRIESRDVPSTQRYFT
jgi:diadenosine tetraphosphatase ApaH/serine/threonine PP2A family protein phosphatase